MKRKMLILTVLCPLIALVARPASGQAGVKVKVPFEFVVADKTLPEGEYLIWWNTDKVFVQNQQGNFVALAFSTSLSERHVGKTGQAVFQCYERRCFLSQVWSPTRAAGRQVRKCHLETLVAKEDLAANKAAPARFTLIAKDTE